jgi:type I restriction-modification system DNA methylase subunit
MSEKVANLEKKIEKLEKIVPVIEFSKTENLEEDIIPERISTNSIPIDATMSTTEHKDESNIRIFCEKNNINFNKNVTKVILQKICDKFELDYNKNATLKSHYVIKLSVYFKEHTDELTVELLAEFGVNPSVKKPVTKPDKKPAVAQKSTPKDEKKETVDETKDEKEIEFTITNREDLKDKIHEIHNYLRNGGVAFGMGALKIFNLLYGLARIENFGMIEKTKLDNKCKFSSLHNVKETEIYEKVTNISEIIHNNSEINIYKSISCDIPSNITGKILKHLINDIQLLLDSEERINEQLSGKIYEYFIGRDKSAISDLGAYFTNRHIVEYVYNIVKPQLDDNGNVPSMIDPFGGSGGFTLGYIQWLNNLESSSDTESHINWSKNINNINHIDMNPDVVRYAGMEILCMTKEIPNMDECIICDNAFTYESYKKYKYIFTNPPYGGDKDNNKSMYAKLTRTIAFLVKKLETENDVKKIDKLKKQAEDFNIKLKSIKTRKETQKVSINNSSNFIKKYCTDNKLDKSKYKDKESVSLILMMALLDIGGTAVGVLKEGVFFDKKYSTLRKHLVETFDVKLVISVPQNQFENTSTKTSILIFEKPINKKTTSIIEFRKLDVINYDDDVFEEINGNWVLTYMKDDIKELGETRVSTANLNELKTSNYNFDGKKYNLKELIPGDGFKMVKIGTIVKFLSKSKRKASFGKSEGLVPFYTSSDKIKYCDIADYKEESIIIGTGGNSSLHYNNTLFSCSGDNIIITSKQSQYIYYIIKSLWGLFMGQMSGSTIKHVNKNMLENFKIPVPEDTNVMQMWVDRISKPYDEKLTNAKLLEQKEQQVMDEIKRITEKEECDEKKLETLLKRKNNGSTNSTDVIVNSKLNIPFYAARCKNPYGYTGHYDFDGDDYLLFAKSGGNASCKFGNQLGIGKFWRIHGKCSANVAMIKYDFIQEIYNINYIVNYLLRNLHDIQRMAIYTTGNGNINLNDLNDFIIKIPKNKSLIDNLEPLFQEIEQLKTDIENAELLFKQEIEELRKASLKE